MDKPMMSEEELKALLIDAFMVGYAMARRDKDWAKYVAGGLINVTKDKNTEKLTVTYKNL